MKLITQMKKTKINDFNIYEILEEYKPNDSIFDEDDLHVKRLKSIIYNDLDETERRIILVYAELESTRQCKEVFGVGHTTIFLKIKEIQNKIIQKYKELYDNC